MRRRMVALILLLAGLLSLHVSSSPALASPTSCGTVTSGLISCWPGEGNAQDAVGSNNGNLVGNVGFVPGVSGQAFNFDGTDYVDIPDNASLAPSSQITVAAWIKPVFAGRPFQNCDGDVVFERLSPSGFPVGYLLSDTMDPTCTVYYQQPAPSVPLGTPAFFLSTTGGTNQIFGPTPLPNDGAFHCVAGTFDGAAMHLYVDGSMVTSRDVTGTIINTPGVDPLIGNEQNFSRTSKAAIDEVHLYNRALTNQEIASVCTVPSANTAPSVNALPNAPINEGSAYTASGSFTDPDAGDAWTASVDYGDGSGKQALALNADKTFNLSHVYDDNGSYPVTVTVTDKAGASGSGTATVTVNNVPPTITSLSGPTQVLTGTKLSYNGTATDPSNADTKAGFTWNWSIDGAAAAIGNPTSLTFSSCGSHTVSATATDKDGSTSAPASLASKVSASDGAWQPPLYSGQYNVAKVGSVIPVKITLGCNGTPLTGLAPTIQLIQGDVDGTTDTGTNDVTTTSVSSADTTGIMRFAAPQYIYNLQVPSAPSGTQFTIRVRPFGDSDPADGMYVLIKIK